MTWRRATDGRVYKLTFLFYRGLEWGILFCVGIWLVEFSAEIAKEYHKIKNEKENGGGAAAKKSDGGSGKEDKISSANKIGAKKVMLINKMKNSYTYRNEGYTFFSL